jgi:hypothetical protein
MQSLQHELHLAYHPSAVGDATIDNDDEDDDDDDDDDDTRHVSDSDQETDKYTTDYAASDTEQQQQQQLMSNPKLELDALMRQIGQVHGASAVVLKQQFVNTYNKSVVAHDGDDDNQQRHHHDHQATDDIEHSDVASNTFASEHGEQNGHDDGNQRGDDASSLSSSSSTTASHKATARGDSTILVRGGTIADKLKELQAITLLECGIANDSADDEGNGDDDDDANVSLLSRDRSGHYANVENESYLGSTLSALGNDGIARGGTALIEQLFREREELRRKVIQLQQALRLAETSASLIGARSSVEQHRHMDHDDGEHNEREQYEEHEQSDEADEDVDQDHDHSMHRRSIHKHNRPSCEQPHQTQQHQQQRHTIERQQRTIEELSTQLAAERTNKSSILVEQKQRIIDQLVQQKVELTKQLERITQQHRHQHDGDGEHQRIEELERHKQAVESLSEQLEQSVAQNKELHLTLQRLTSSSTKSMASIGGHESLDDDDDDEASRIGTLVLARHTV